MSWSKRHFSLDAIFAFRNSYITWILNAPIGELIKRMREKIVPCARVSTHTYKKYLCVCVCFLSAARRENPYTCLLCGGKSEKDDQWEWGREIENVKKKRLGESIREKEREGDERDRTKIVGVEEKDGNRERKKENSSW